MFRKLALSLLVVCACAAIPALAEDKCSKGKFVGTYTRPDLNHDIFGDGSVLHSFAQQLTLSSDGTARLDFTGFPDYLLTIGTGAAQVGSWVCRADGKLVVNMIGATYAPEVVGEITDLVLQFNQRDSYLFAITDDNTLTREAFRQRRYMPAQDLTDPNAGVLRPLITTTPVYKRVIASDADLVAP
jgi:hypothetical protein